MGEHKQTLNFCIFDANEKVETATYLEPLDCHLPEAQALLIWYRYCDPNTKLVWFQCSTEEKLWFFASEVKNLVDREDGNSEFIFQGNWQMVMDGPRFEATAEG